MATKMPEMWVPEQVEPIPLLARLREAVLRHNDGKRCPKWAFRLAGDLAVQLQPRPTFLASRPGAPQRALEFLGLAHHEIGDDLPHNVFRLMGSDLELRGVPWCRIAFVLFANSGEDTWTFRATSVRWARSLQSPRDMLLGCRERVIQSLPCRLATIRPELMLTRSCLVCGKALTDPASLARWIGPECAGSGALAVGGMDRDQLAERLFA